MELFTFFKSVLFHSINWYSCKTKLHLHCSYMSDKLLNLRMSITYICLSQLAIRFVRFLCTVWTQLKNWRKSTQRILTGSEGARPLGITTLSITTVSIVTPKDNKLNNILESSAYTKHNNTQHYNIQHRRKKWHSVWHCLCYSVGS
jgi:hypothetical protein